MTERKEEEESVVKSGALEMEKSKRRTEHLRANEETAMQRQSTKSDDPIVILNLETEEHLHPRNQIDLAEKQFEDADIQTFSNHGSPKNQK